MNGKLPDGWEEKTLGECFKLKSGDNLTSKMMGGNGKFPVYGGNGIAGMYNKFNLSGSNIIIGRVGALCGNVRHIKEEIWLTDNAFKITDSKYHFDHAFLTYLLNFKNLRSYARQAAQPVISNSSLEDVLLQFPKSEEEQQRIVAILDEAFAAIATAKENAEKNLQNARELFESYLQSVFANPGDGWEVKKMGEVCGFTRGPFGGSLKKAIFKKDGYAVYEQAHAIYSQFNDVRYFIDGDKFKEMQRFELNSGDLIMSCSGTMGKVAIVPENIKRGIINQALLRLAPTKKISNVFLKLWMESENFQESLKAYSQGAAIQNVASVKILKEIKMPVPPIPEQRAIVAKLDALSAETKKLEAIYRQKLADLDELKKSVLQKAFDGEL